MVLQGEFPEGVVKETLFQFGADSVKGFLQEHGIKPDHHLIFDELICTKYTKQFLDSLIALKDSVKSLWIAMGAQPVTGNDKGKINRGTHFNKTQKVSKGCVTRLKNLSVLCCRTIFQNI